MKRRALLKGVAAGVVAALGVNGDLGARVLLDTKCQHFDLAPGDPSADYHQCLSCGEKVSGIDLLQVTGEDRECLTDLIYDISPAETPFRKRGRAVDIYETDFGWYEVPRHPLTE